MEKENLNKTDEIREKEMANGIFRAYNVNNRLKNSTLTFQENSLLAVTDAHVLSKQKEENNIPYSSIRSFKVHEHGLGKVVEIKTAAKNYKFHLFNTKAFVEFLNKKIKQYLQ